MQARAGKFAVATHTARTAECISLQYSKIPIHQVPDRQSLLACKAQNKPRESDRFNEHSGVASLGLVIIVMGLHYLESRGGDGQGLFVRWWGGMEFWRRVELLGRWWWSRGGFP